MKVFFTLTATLLMVNDICLERSDVNHKSGIVDDIVVIKILIMLFNKQRSLRRVLHCDKT